MADYWKYMPEKHVADLSTVVMAPMPGLVKSVAVEVGQNISEGQEVSGWGLRIRLEGLQVMGSVIHGTE